VSEIPGSADLPASVTLVGAGKMGLALLQGWAARGLAGDGVAILEPNPSAQLADLASRSGFRLNPRERRAPEALVLAIKPQLLDAVAPSIAEDAAPETIVVSILAGKRVADLSARLPKARAIVRAMPNTPAAIGRGITGAFANAAVSAAQREAAHALLSSVGEVEWVESEALIDAVTAVSGSGPAYVFYFVECLTRAGVEAGLPEEIAAKLARATASGAGELLRRNPATSAAALRENVTSPGGTTAAALQTLMAQDGLEPLLARAVRAAKRRAEELSG
jgi:pyrroline-5-carboxylate reductase